MRRFKTTDLGLKVGNLAIASFLSLVPTLITIIVFYIYGLNICSILNARELFIDKDYSILLCKSSIFDLNTYYFFFIWVFITLPTWIWFYLNHAKRKKINRR